MKPSELILVVDDNDTKRYTVTRTLTRGGYQIIEATTGNQAIELAAKRLPDLMVVDIRLPDINGFEVCRSIKSNAGTSFIPVLHFSATMNTPDARIYGLEEGADAFLTQEAKPEELLATVKALLRMRRTEVELRRQNTRLEIISRAAEHLLASNNPDTMVNELFKEVGAHLGIDTYFNFMVNAAGDALMLDSYSGIPADVAATLNRLEFGQALCGVAALNVEPVVATYIQQSDDPRAALVKSFGIRAYACNPLVSSGRLLGTLSFAARDRDLFEEDELEFLRTICHYVALAKEKEDMLQKAQSTAVALVEANRRKDDFLANMSHEIRTPMNAVLGLANILKRSQPLTERQEEYISTLLVSAQSLLVLINDLLDIAKIESESVQLESMSFNLRELLEEVAAISSVKASEKGIRLSGTYDERLREHFLGDPTRLKQILINLVTNAIKFTDEGSVAIELTRADEGKDRTLVNISIIDTGIGIDPAMLTGIFNKFSQGDSSITRRYGGTGLGLAITKSLVGLMQGEIFVTSEPGEGSVFSVKIPLLHDMPQNARQLAELPPKLNEQMMLLEIAPLILLVEDNQPNVIVASTLLETLGYRYEVAEDGEEALKKIRETHFDMVLMDVQMPGMDGFSTTRRIRAEEKKQNKPPVPIIGVTAHAMDSDKEKCLKAGMNDYLSKPFRLEELERKMAGLLMRVAESA